MRHSVSGKDKIGILGLLPGVCGMALLLLCMVHARAEDGSIKVDRSPLTFRDSGLYANPPFWHGRDPADEGLTNLLTPERAATEAPWSFYILQGRYSKQKPSEEDVRIIRDLAAHGKKVILRVKLPGGLHSNHDFDAACDVLENVLTTLNPDWLYAITLDEENVYWGGNIETLSKLYYWCKERWPDLLVFQWWTPMEVPNVRAESGWVALPADGWVIDLYGRPADEFEQKLVRALETGKPVIHIIWSSPTWLQYSGGETWEEGRRVFQAQMDVCRGYNIPVAHFCAQNRVLKDGKVVHPIRWGWHAEDEEVRDWYREMETLAKNNRLLPDALIGFRTLDQKKFDWADASLSRGGDMRYGLDALGRERVEVGFVMTECEPREDMLLEVGESGDYMDIRVLLDTSAQALEKPHWAVRGKAGKSVKVPIVLEVTPKRPLTALRVDLLFDVTASRAGQAVIWTSKDGRNWKEAGRVKEKNTVFSVDWEEATEAFSQKKRWLKVELQALSGTDTAFAAELKKLTVYATIAERLE